MNKFDSIIEEDLDNFDFEETAAIMRVLNHEWHGEGIPTVLQIRKEVRKRLIDDYKRLIELKEEFVYSSSGGIRIECHYNAEDGYWADIMYCPVETLR